MRFRRGASALSTTCDPRIWRLLLVVLLVRMWRLNAFDLMNFPVAVFLKRLAAPRWLFNFGIVFSHSLRRHISRCAWYWRPAFRDRLGLLDSGPRRQNRVHLVAFLQRHRFDHHQVAQLTGQPLEDATPDLGMRHFTPAEKHGGLD